jgi:hypothetical protein
MSGCKNPYVEACSFYTDDDGFSKCWWCNTYQCVGCVPPNQINLSCPTHGRIIAEMRQPTPIEAIMGEIQQSFKKGKLPWQTS